MASGGKDGAAADAEQMVPCEQCGTGVYIFYENTSLALKMLLYGASIILVGLLACFFGPITPQSNFLPQAPQHEFKLNMFGEDFPSGNPYIVTSISAAVGDWNSSAGKIFRTCILTGAIIILISNYPAYLSNVYFKYSNRHPFPNVNTARSIAIPAGIIVVGFCPLSPPNMMDKGEMLVMYGFHMAGALGAIIVFLICEYHDLYQSTITFAKYEKSARGVLWWIVVGSLVLFIIGEAIGALPLGICCNDVFLPVNSTAIERAQKNKAYIQEASDKMLEEMYRLSNAASHYPLYQGLYDTAHGAFLVWRVVGVYAELAIFVAMLFSHLAVWYFSPQREGVQRQRYIPTEFNGWI